MMSSINLNSLRQLNQISRRYNVFHLFKKVYLAADDAIDVNNNRIVISETNGFGMLIDLDAVSHGTLKDYATSLEELVGPGKKYENFLQLLNAINHFCDESATKVIIYCDKTAFLKIAVLWLKVLLPNANMDDCYGIVSSYQFQNRMFGTSEYASVTRAYRLNQVSEYITIQEFNQVFTATSVDTAAFAGFINLVKPHLSIEFILATYISNQSCKEELRKIAFDKLKVGMQQYLYECKDFILSNMLNKPVFDKFSPTVNYTLGNLEEITRDPAFDIWFDTSLWDIESIGIPSSKSKFYFDRMSPSQFDKFKAHMTIYLDQNNIYINPEAIIGDMTWIDWILENLNMCRNATLSDSDLTKLVEYQLSDKKPNAQFTVFEVTEKDRYNMFILNQIKQAVADSQNSKLNPFVLA